MAGNRVGQCVRLGVIVDAVYDWRAYSLTSDPQADDGLISVTPKVVPTGTVSPYLVREIAPGDIVRLGEVEGVFTLPEPLPDRLLFISAGSGITAMSMLRDLDHPKCLRDVVAVHSDRTAEQMMFDSTGCAPIGVTVRRCSPGPATCSTRWSSTGTSTVTPRVCTSIEGA
jgi:stearoyl-CoA 9-desaturase NADPH oxidoreductase